MFPPGHSVVKRQTRESQSRSSPRLEILLGDTLFTLLAQILSVWKLPVFPWHPLCFHCTFPVCFCTEHMYTLSSPVYHCKPLSSPVIPCKPSYFPVHAPDNPCTAFDCCLSILFSYYNFVNHMCYILIYASISAINSAKSQERNLLKHVLVNNLLIPN